MLFSSAIADELVHSSQFSVHILWEVACLLISSWELLTEN
jgi:hypothetical protein